MLTQEEAVEIKVLMRECRNFGTGCSVFSAGDKKPAEAG
jgi:hypothetical protein